MSDDFMPPDRPLQPGDRLGRYEIREQLGQGGMGIVFRARDTMPHLAGREVALKVLISALFESDSLQRFLGEAHALSRIEHPNIVRIFDCVADDERPFIVMEYLKGEDLNKLLRRGPIDIPFAIDIILSVCAAIHACHRHGVVHRDLKPANVMLHRPSPGIEIVKVLDFGVSKSALRPGPDLTNHGSLVVGTPRYMSPEQAAGAVADARSDQYAIALLLQVLLLRRKPFHDFEDPSLAVIAAGISINRRKLRPEIPEGVDAVLDRALCVDPAQRFTSVHELGSKLLPFASDDGRALWRSLFTSAAAADLPPALLSGSIPLSLPISPVGLNSATVDERNISTVRATALTAALLKQPISPSTKTSGEQGPSPAAEAEPLGPPDGPTPSAPPVTLDRPAPGSQRPRGILVLTAAMTAVGAAAVGLYSTIPRQPTRLPAAASSPNPPESRHVSHAKSPPAMITATPPATLIDTELPPTNPIPLVEPSTAGPVATPSLVTPKPAASSRDRSFGPTPDSRYKRSRPASKRPSPLAGPREPGVEYTDDGSPVLK